MLSIIDAALYIVKKYGAVRKNTCFTDGTLKFHTLIRKKKEFTDRMPFTSAMSATYFQKNNYSHTDSS